MSRENIYKYIVKILVWNKKYYEKNSEIVKEKAKNYMKKIKETNPEKLKEWRHQAYLQQKKIINKKIDLNKFK